MFLGAVLKKKTKKKLEMLKQMSKAGDGYEFRIQIKRLKEKTILLRYD
uniref:Uncharacterized protein n=1 Tax=Sus scrofa TaxID=9823 RepID=A0A8D0WBU5_PIG